jgi:hypothetical protein
MDMSVIENALGERDLAVTALFDKITKSFDGSTEKISARLADMEQKVASARTASSPSSRKVSVLGFFHVMPRADLRGTPTP